MRIPLDYYRILGVPVQVTDEQLSQAYHDRSWQRPRREYSEAAIAARKALLEQAYNLLSDSEERANYQQQFLAKTEAIEPPAKEVRLPSLETESPQESVPDSNTPWIEIQPEHLVGALVILQELGEYELILRLAKRYFAPSQSQAVDSEAIAAGAEPHLRADLTLLLALTYLELSREQWQQGTYEQAAASGHHGLDLLKQEQLFAPVQAEIQAELYKLRPYQILELLALPQEREAERKRGIALLKAMLEERQGIDGHGDDRSGLGIDDFLRFIQQLRLYLTVEEQQALFEAEAQRPSAAALYLAVYALLARGFVQKKPAYIAQANTLLQGLSDRQDVYLEQAVCALLLGQVEEANRALENSQEQEPLVFIREHSKDSPDLLPGLCLYGEHWLEHEVFSHFRDLAELPISLKDYFADEEVQAYLEGLSIQPKATDRQAEIETEEVTAVAIPKTASGSPDFFEYRRAQRRHKSSRSRSRHIGSAERRETTSPTQKTQRRHTAHPKEAYSTPLAVGAEYASQPTSLHSPRRRQQGALTRSQPATSIPSQPPLETPSRRLNRRSRRKWSINPRRFLLSLAIVIFGIGAVGILVRSLQVGSDPLAALEGDALLLSLNEPPIAIPPIDAKISLSEAILTQTGAKAVIQTWLSSKAQAFGQQHQIDRLNDILSEPLLSTWRDRAETLKANNGYWQYEHSLQVDALKTSERDPKRATVEATVKETANYYQNGQLNRDRSYDETLRVRYELTYQKDRWLIQAIQVLS